jgi:hypothetical protein
VVPISDRIRQFSGNRPIAAGGSGQRHSVPVGDKFPTAKSSRRFFARRPCWCEREGTSLHRVGTFGRSPREKRASSRKARAQQKGFAGANFVPARAQHLRVPHRLSEKRVTSDISLFSNKFFFRVLKLKGSVLMRGLNPRMDFISPQKSINSAGRVCCFTRVNKNCRCPLNHRFEINLF